MTHCIFCQDIKPEQIIYQTQSFKVILDIDPIQRGHLLILSKHHYESMTELPKETLHELVELESHLISRMEETLSIDGVTLAINDKNLKDEGTHFHVHLIPRVKNDGFWDKLSIQQENWNLDNFLKAL